jgi:hypothetical protein
MARGTEAALKVKRITESGAVKSVIDVAVMAELANP